MTVAENGDKLYFTGGKLTRMKRGPYDLKITLETIKAKGWREWGAVTQMGSNENRLVCADWVIGLIEKGVLKPDEAEI
jgi:hypothetical protein